MTNLATAYQNGMSIYACMRTYGLTYGVVRAALIYMNVHLHPAGARRSRPKQPRNASPEPPTTPRYERTSR